MSRLRRFRGRRLEKTRTRLRLLGCGVVDVADDARDFPGAVFVLPEVNELAFGNGLCVFVARVVEAMNSNFDCAVALHVIDLERAWNEFPGHSAADILFYAFGQCCP